MSILSVSPIRFYTQKQNANSANISFKQRASRTDASAFASIYFNTIFSVDPKTNTKKLAQKDKDGKIAKEIYLDKNDKILKMKEYPQNSNVKETIFEKDGITVKEIREFAKDAENIILKQTTYNEQDMPVEKIYNRSGILTKTVETTKQQDSEIKITTIYDEKNTRPTQKTVSGKDDTKTTQYFYDEKGRLTKTVYTETNFKKTNLYNPKNEKIIRSDIHYFTKYQNPKADGTGTDTYTLYDYDKNEQLIKEKTFKTLNNELLNGTKYNTQTGKKYFYLDRTYNNHYAQTFDKDGKLLSSRFYPSYNTVKTLYYDKDIPYREVILDKGKYSIDKLYKPDKKKYTAENKIDAQELISKKYKSLDDYNFNKLIRLFNRHKVIEIEKDYTNPQYDIFKIKLPKDSTKEA